MDKKNWVPLNTKQDTLMMLEEISSLLQFIKDLSTPPTSPAGEYSFSAKGYYGFYYFLDIIQDMLDNCHKAIHKNFKTEGEVN